MEDILSYLKDREEEMLALLERLVNMDSGTYCKECIDACGRIITGDLAKLGFRIKLIGQRQTGDHVQAERPGKGSRRLLILAHLDTVFPAGTAAEWPFRRENGMAYGPGVGDIKGGIMQVIYALKALHHLQREAPAVTFFLTADEEIGSVTGRPYIEEIARQSSHVLVMEPASTMGSIAVRRWGIGSFYLTLHGKAAHVLHPEIEGVNACRELALKILALESLTDTRRGIKVSVNLVSGGRSRQVTAATARADIDVRVRDARLMTEVEERVRQVAEHPILPGIRIQLKGSLTRPPMEPHPKTEDFFKLAQKVAAEIGLEIQPSEEYGGSDGCLTAALGVPTLDSLGPVCHDMCGDDERIEIASLVPRTALLAGIIQRLADAAE